MEGDTASRVSQADDDCRSDVSLASGTSCVPRQDGILSRLDEGFQESKSDLIQRFLMDQAELNRRFEEIGEDEKANEQSLRDASKDTLEETEKLLRRKLTLHGRTMGYQRSRTSMGFHNQTEFHRAANTNSSSVSSESEDSDEIISTSRIPQDAPYYKPKDIPLRVIVPPIVLQPILRPKTSVGRRRASQPQSITTESGNTYQTVPHTQLTNTASRSVGLHQSYPSATFSHGGAENRHFVPSRSIKVGISMNKNNVSPSESRFRPGVSNMLTVSCKKRKDNCVRGQVSNSYNVDSSRAVVKQRRKVNQRHQIHVTDGESPKIDLKLSTVNGRRSSLVKLPPLDKTVSQTPSRKPLNHPCH